MIGATSMQPVVSGYKFRDIEEGVWEFVSQEVVFKAFLERDINLRKHQYKDIVRVARDFKGMIYSPNHRIVDRRGNFSIHSTANGLALQGRHRGQVNRFVMHDYMFREEIPEGSPYYGIPGYERRDGGYVNDGVQINQSNWIRIGRDSLGDFYSEREYYDPVGENEDLLPDDRAHEVYGYFLEPFKLATSYLGIGDDTDCIFEWEINFALTPMMRRLMKENYIVVNLATETIVPGGAAFSEVTHLYLKEDMFGRSRIEGSLGTSQWGVGYYTFKFTGRNGAGNSEKLYIWSDGCVALRSLKLSAQVQTSARTMPLITQVDVSRIEEL